MDAEQINKKIEITWAAVEIYEEKGRVSIPDLVRSTKLSATEIYQIFPNKKAILAYYYPAMVLQYWAMIDEIEDFEEYSISEKLSNFIYTIFDMMGEKHTFVKATFNKCVFSKRNKSAFHEETTSLLKEFLTTDANIAVSAGFFMGDFYYKTLSTQFLFLIKFWLSDSSTDKERSLALADKLSALFEEIVYNKTLDKGFDLIKFMVGNTNIENWLPNVGRYSSTKENNSNKEEEEKDKDE